MGDDVGALAVRPAREPSPEQPLRVLNLEDRQADSVLMQAALAEDGISCEVVRTETREEFVAALERGGFDLIIADYALPSFDGGSALTLAREIRPDLPFIFFTGAMGEEAAIETLTRGASDYVLKGRMNKLAPAVRRALAATAEHDARRRAERDLLAEKAISDSVIASLPGIFFILDRQGRIRRRNQGYELAARALDERIERVHPREIFAAKDRAQIGCRIEEAFERGASTAQAELAVGDGRRIPCLFSAQRVLLGAEECIIGMGLDISEQKAAEQAIGRQLGRTRLLNQIARAIAERQELDSMLRVVLGQLAQELPLAAAAILLHDGRDDALLLHLEDARTAELAAALGVREGARIPVERSGLRLCLEGKLLCERDLGTSAVPLLRSVAHAGLRSGVAAPFSAEGRTFGILAVFRGEVDGFGGEEVDFIRQVSEHVALAMHQAQLYKDLKRAYEELAATQQIALQQERLRALGQMASGIAHDINNALTPISLYTELLAREETGLGEEGQRYLQCIRMAAGDIEHTVARMREFYRSREDRELPDVVDLNALVKGVIDLTRPRWRDLPQRAGCTVEVETRLQEHLPGILGVESELRGALTNLIINAVDAIPSGGVIAIGTEEVPARDAQGAGAGGEPRVLLWIRDSGVGMDEETRLRCLEPFYTTKGERGTGLGLAMVYGIVQRHGAAIEIESAPGKGTTFRLLFPEARGTTGHPEPHASSASGGGPALRILCIDDEERIREGLEQVLRSDGHRVTSAEGGRAGLTALRIARQGGDPFQLVITDLGMPGMDGLETARLVKEEFPDTPVILLTGWGRQLAAEGQPTSGVDRVLPKPPNIADLRGVIAELAVPDRPRAPAFP